MGKKLDVSLQDAIRAPWFTRTGIGADSTKEDVAYGNDFHERWKTADGTGYVLGVGVNTSDQLSVGGSIYVPQRYMKTFKLATNASIATQAFWIADIACKVTGINCIFDVTDGAANTAYISKATGTQAPTGGTSLMSGTFNMNATARTEQSATLTTASGYPSILTLAVGDRLVFNLASAVTNLAGVAITVAMTPGNKSLTAELVMNANGDLIAATAIFVANGSYNVTAVRAIWSAAATVGTVTYDVFHDTSTNAPAAGTSILTAAVSLKTTANTVSTATLTGTAATLRLDAGDRLSVKLNGTLTTLAGLVVVVSLTPIQGLIEVNWALAKNANLAVDQTIFIADRTYELTCASEVHATAAGGALTANLTRDSGTTAAGGGTSLQSGTFNLNATANTVQVATNLGIQGRFLLAGDRLSIHFSTTVQALAGVAVTVQLQPR